jgi:proteasome lid subunit RPN8/RPN11
VSQPDGGSTELKPAPGALDPSLLAELAAHAAQAWPAECCGVVVSDGAGALRYLAIPNIAGSAEAGPSSSRTVRDGYVMDPRALMAALEETDARGGALQAIVHSHPEVGAYFSAEDRRAALGGGDEPLWPGVAYVVISCRGGVSDAAMLYRWDEVRRDFCETPLSLAGAR